MSSRDKKGRDWCNTALVSTCIVFYTAQDMDKPGKLQNPESFKETTGFFLSLLPAYLSFDYDILAKMSRVSTIAKAPSLISPMVGC